MNHTNYVSQSTLKITALLLTSLLALTCAESSSATACNLKKTDLLVDSTALMEKILSESSSKDASFQKVSYSPRKPNVLDHKFHSIDRTLPYFESMNGVGIITGRSFSNTTQTYGSATLVGSCYVLTNKHVVKALLEERGRNLKTGESFNFSVGQRKDCSSKDQFENMNQEVTLVDHGSENGPTNSIQSDWAILKLKKPIKNLKPVNVGSPYFNEGQMLVRSGFPLEEVKKNSGFTKLSGQYMQNVEFTSGGVGIGSDEGIRPGISGGGIFYTKFDGGIPKAYFAGISVGNIEDGKTGYLPALALKSLIKKSGKVSWTELTNQDETQNCE